MEMNLPTSDAAATPPLCGGSLKATACEMKWQARSRVLKFRTCLGSRRRADEAGAIQTWQRLAAVKTLESRERLISPFARSAAVDATDHTARLEPLCSRISGLEDQQRPDSAARST